MLKKIVLLILILFVGLFSFMIMETSNSDNTAYWVTDCYEDEYGTHCETYEVPDPVDNWYDPLYRPKTNEMLTPQIYGKVSVKYTPDIYYPKVTVFDGIQTFVITNSVSGIRQYDGQYLYIRGYVDRYNYYNNSSVNLRLNQYSNYPF